MNKQLATGLLAGAVLFGAGAAIVANASPAAATDTVGSATIQLAANSSTDGTGPWAGDRGMGGGMGRPDAGDRAEDLQVAATALGMTTTDLEAQLEAGKSLADVAKAQSVDVQKVIDALVADKTDELKAELKAGTLTQAQFDEMSSRVTQFITDQVNRAGGMCRGGHGPDGAMGGGMGRPDAGDRAADLQVAATALGISTTDLETQLQAGKSLADVAKAQSVDVQKVIDALVADKTDELKAELKAGTLTQAQFDEMTSRLSQFITDRVNGIRGMGPGGHGPDGDHDGGRGPLGQPTNSAPTGKSL